jgi:hypothetical protein
VFLAVQFAGWIETATSNGCDTGHCRRFVLH